MLNARAFEAYVEQFLAPTLSPGEAVGAAVPYLPPIPDFSPIEKLFAKLKAPLRKAAERTVEGLRRPIGKCLDRFSPHECVNSFEAAGYEPI
jgi:hypothetical protein